MSCPQRTTVPGTATTPAPYCTRAQIVWTVNSPSCRTIESTAGKSRRMLSYSNVAKWPPTAMWVSTRLALMSRASANSSGALAWNGTEMQTTRGPRSRTRCTISRASLDSLNGMMTALNPSASTADAR